MGSWSVYCGISKIAITAGNDCVLLPIKRTEHSEYMKYSAATLPIFGKYNDYGGLEDIEENENTKLIEEYFGISVEEFVTFFVDGKLTYGRDEAKSVELKLNDSGKYNEIKDWNFMFIDRKVYDYMSQNNHGESNDLDFGNPKILELIGFKYIGEDKKNPTRDPKRFCNVWELGGKKIYTDGTWAQIENGSIYTFKGKYSALVDSFDIPEDKMWIGDKSMIQLWSYLKQKKQKELLLWILDVSRYETEFDLSYFLDVYEVDSVEELPERAKFKLLEKTNPKYFVDHYKKNLTTFGDGLAELVTLKMSMRPMSTGFEPFVLYQTPQCGDYIEHNNLLNKFVEINNSYRNFDDEDDEE